MSQWAEASEAENKTEAVQWLKTVEEANFAEKRKAIATQPVGVQRIWFKDALKEGTFLATLYWVKGIDLEADLGDFAERYATSVVVNSQGVDRDLVVNDLKRIWRRQVARYGYGGAWKTETALSQLEKWSWRWWRRTNWLMPRLGMAVMAGFLLITGMSGVAWYMEEIVKSYQAGWVKWVVWAACAAGSFVVGLWEVQQRVGRRPGWQILGRAGVLWIWAAAYAGLGGLALDQMMKAARWGKEPAVIASWTMAALALAFVLQIFWQDTSVGEGL